MTLKCHECKTFLENKIVYRFIKECSGCRKSFNGYDCSCKWEEKEINICPKCNCLSCSYKYKKKKCLFCNEEFNYCNCKYNNNICSNTECQMLNSDCECMNKKICIINGDYFGKIYNDIPTEYLKKLYDHDNVLDIIIKKNSDKIKRYIEYRINQSNQ